MARTRTGRWVLLAVALLMSAGTLALAQQQVGMPQYVGIPSNLMNQHYTQQRSMQWCWAACIQMVLSRYGVSVPQEEIVRRTYGTDAQGKLPDMPANMQQITANLNNWGIDSAGRRYLVQAVVGSGPPSLQALISELNAGYPVILGCQTAFIGHAIVCTAASYVLVQTDPAGQAPPVPNVLSLVVRDPMPPQSAMNFLAPSAQGRAEYRADQLARAISWHWFIRVQVEGQPQQSMNTSGKDQLVGAPKGMELGAPVPATAIRVSGAMPRPHAAEPLSARPPEEESGDGIELAKSDVQWHEGPAQPYAHFRLEFSNKSQEVKACEVIAEVELASRKTGQFVRVFQSRPYRFELRPGRSHAVEGTLDAYQDLEVHPRFNCRVIAKTRE